MTKDEFVLSFVAPFSFRTMIKYFLYARKSQDRSDRQVMSIDGQINEIKRFAQSQGYLIVDILIEQKSAKQPGRPVFNQMIERLQNGEANGILCWKLNRIARNPIDAGTISWFLQSNVIQAIHSKERSYLPTDNVLMMQIDFGIANQFIKDLSGDVKRGLRDKANDGWMPQSILPIGYMHHPDTQNAKQQIIRDRIRFPIIRELWKLMEAGAYSVLDIKLMADKLGLVNRNGNKYALSTFYLIFRNPVYYGKFYWKDENGNPVLHEGKHEVMVSELSFRKVQKVLANRSRKTRSQRHSYTYRGLIACGECNGHVTAERKLQVICTKCKHKYSIISNEVCRKCNTPLSQMNNPSIIDITYYRCTRRKHPTCKQKGITEAVIENQIIQALETISIPDEMYEWTKQHIDKHAHKNHSDDRVLLDSLRRKHDRVKTKIKNLIDLLVSGEITKKETDMIKVDYESELKIVEQSIFEKENALAIALQNSHSYLNFAQNCIEHFKKGDQKVKKELTAFFCSNLTILDKSLYFSTKKAPDVLSSLQKLLFSYSSSSNLKIGESIRDSE